MAKDKKLEDIVRRTNMEFGSLHAAAIEEHNHDIKMDDEEQVERPTILQPYIQVFKIMIWTLNGSNNLYKIPQYTKNWSVL